MLSSTEKTLILSGTIFGSVFLFSTSLYCINDICINDILRHNDNYTITHKDENNINKLLLVNWLTMLFSGTVFGYFTYKAIK